MFNRLAEGPLNDAELDRLDEILKVHSGEDGFNVEALDGLFAALVCSPILAKPSEWMPIIWGEKEPKWKSADEVQESFTLLMRHWNHVAKSINDGSYAPIYSSGTNAAGEDVVFPYIWVYGFEIGMHVHEGLWFDDSDPILQRLLAPITFLRANLARAIRGMKRRPARKDQDAYADQIPMTVVLLRQYWLKLYPGDHEGQESSETVTRETPKVGRNDPCPCGSGRKYKHCHGASELH